MAETPLAIAQDPELIGDFINEATEHLASIEAQVLSLEQDPESVEPLHAAFRSFHTIKGLAGFMELNDIRQAAHEVETLLDRARNRELPVTPALIDVILSGADYLKRGVNWVQGGLQGKTEPSPDPVSLLNLVRATLEGKAQIDKATPAALASEKAAPAANDTTATSLRVDAAKLDYLIDMVGELLIAQSLLTHSAAEFRSNALFQRHLQQLGRISSEVQRVAMGLRMMPVSQLFGRMTRLVRDLSRKTGKRVHLEFSGEETELDKTIIEQLADPLMHMVRNSMDHGLETPEERAQTGKSPEGRVELAAAYQGGNVVITISDDGRGLNLEKILRKAREKGIVAATANLPENEIFQLIFAPGFSTAEKVTDVSGRGVGMDVVRRQIEALRGHIEIESTTGQGTRIGLHLPLTLAIIEGLIVQSGNECYIIPISAVREMVRPVRSMLFTIEGQREMVMIRHELYPIVRLARRFHTENAVEDPVDGLLVLTESEGRRFCLLVDQMSGKQEVVMKNLGPLFQHVAGICGGAILADGRVGLILDVNSLLP